MISGASLAVQQLAIGQATGGHHVLVLAASDRPPGYTIKSGGLQITRLPSWYNPYRVGQRLLLWPQRAILAALAKFHPDVIHLHEPFGIGLIGLQAARRLQIPVVFTAHQLPWFAAAYTPDLLGLPHLVEKTTWQYARWFLRRCAAVIAPTTTIAKIVQERLHFPIQVVNYGADLHRFQPFPAIPAEARQLRHKYGLDPHLPVILHVGRLDVEKQVDLLVHAAAQVMGQMAVQFLIVGDGCQRQNLSQLSQTLGVAKQCHFPGYILPEDDLPGLYRLASAFITASQIETFGIVVLEAMACGLPIIAANATCMPELVRPYKNGFLVPPNDSAAIAQHILWLLQHPEVADRLSEASYVMAQHYTVSRMIQEVTAIYTAVHHTQLRQITPIASKLSLIADAEAFNRQKTDGAHQHQQAAHSQGLAVIECTGLAEKAEDGHGEGGRLWAGNENGGSKFAHADREGKDRADQ
jgi:glycosyltransferase involved in cell wall biosynthesis